MTRNPPIETEAGPAPASTPYRTTPVFDEDTLPAALRSEHSTKDGVWGLIRVLDGRLMLHFADGAAGQLLEPGRPGLVAPQQVHHVEPMGPMRMQVEFYDRAPSGD